MVPEVDSASDRSTRDISSAQGRVHMADDLTVFMCQLYRNAGSLKPLEPQRLVQTCIGIALTCIPWHALP